MIALIDYGAGNLTSVKKALTALGAEFIVPATPEECAGAAGLIVPGVGHFSATTALAGPWHASIAAAVRAGTPLLGICVGMQWLYEGSEEAPEVPGLGVLEGRCRLLRGDAAQRLKIPHVGWNAIDVTVRLQPDPTYSNRLLAGIESGAATYSASSSIRRSPATPACRF